MNNAEKSLCKDSIFAQAFQGLFFALRENRLVKLGKSTFQGLLRGARREQKTTGVSQRAVAIT